MDINEHRRVPIEPHNPVTGAAECDGSGLLAYTSDLLFRNSEFNMDQDTHTAAAEKRFSDDGLAQRWSDMYDSETERLEELNFRTRRDVSVDYVSRILPPNGRVLDLGCGTAPVVSELRKRGVSCAGLEYAEDMLKHARERLRSMGLDEGDLHRGDCRHTPFDDASFDVVVCLGVISYVEHYGEVFDEINRLLRPGGYALVSFRNKFNPVLWDPVLTLKVAAKAAVGRLRPEPYAIGRFMDHREFRVKMAERGFEYRDFFGLGFGPIRFNYRPLFGERTSIKLSKAFAVMFSKIGWDLPVRWLADVSLWVYEKAPTKRDVS